MAEVVPQRMREEPVVILTGPRTVGKSTLLPLSRPSLTGPSSTLTARTRERQRPATPALSFPVPGQF